jgi:hypothetical protein
MRFRVGERAEVLPGKAKSGSLLLHKDTFGGLNHNSLLAKVFQFIRVAAPEIFGCEA